ncbi:MAG: hypothetical protein IT290_01020 [Deltaproteobacteria bacterium]|nr:hypothetical protein [Deltaproteobacteria bacterium]
MEPRSNQEIFENILSLVGSEVEVGLISTGEQLRGTITNAMFDSFIVHAKTPRVVRFNDVLFLRRLNG